MTFSSVFKHGRCIQILSDSIIILYNLFYEALFMDASAKFNEKMQSADPKNPTDSQRHDMLYKSLVKAGRAEDYQNIINLLSPLPDIIRYASSGEFKNVKVGIIGGGLSGMAAAFELRKLGFDITVFEPTTTHMGGRIYTYYFNDNKTLYGELGAMRFPVSHETVWHYIDLFKLDTEPLLQSDPETFFYIRGIRVKNDSEGKNIFHKIYPQFELTVQEMNTPWPALLGKVNSYYLSTMPPDIRKQFLMILPAYDHRYQSIENLSSRQAL
ncbi:MAG TPA: hypothetical protein DD426_02060 [Clostridiaceae bacterium]|nr:hypothetical protein [Clostridiaceae bacterium]